MKKLIFIFVIFIASAPAFSQEIGDTLWTYNFNKEWAGINSALFSPDGQFIYANADYQHELLYTYKFTLTGKIVEKITGLNSGIRQFSKDGKYFWTDNLYKYEYPSFKKIDSLKNHNPKYGIAQWVIKDDINVGIIIHGDENCCLKDKHFEIFDPSTMTVTQLVQNPDSTARFRNLDISPDGKYFAFALDKAIPDGPSEKIISDRVEIWDAKELKPIKMVFDFLESEQKKVGFSNDGNYFALTGNNYLRLYTTADYKLVKNFDYVHKDCGLRSFAFSLDSKNLYICGCPLDKYNLSNFKLTKTWPIPQESIFIKESPDGQILIGAHYGNSKLEVLNNGYTSVPNEIIQEIKLKQEIITKELIVSFVNNQSSFEYTITDLKGNLMDRSTIFPNLSNELRIDVSKYPKGIYFFNTRIKNQDYHLKFIKE